MYSCDHRALATQPYTVQTNLRGNGSLDYLLHVALLILSVVENQPNAL